MHVSCNPWRIQTGSSQIQICWRSLLLSSMGYQCSEQLSFCLDFIFLNNILFSYSRKFKRFPVNYMYSQKYLNGSYISFWFSRLDEIYHLLTVQFHWNWEFLDILLRLNRSCLICYNFLHHIHLALYFVAKI